VKDGQDPASRKKARRSNRAVDPTISPSPASASSSFRSTPRATFTLAPLPVVHTRCGLVCGPRAVGWEDEGARDRSRCGSGAGGLRVPLGVTRGVGDSKVDHHSGCAHGNRKREAPCAPRNPQLPIKPLVPTAVRLVSGESEARRCPSLLPVVGVSAGRKGGTNVLAWRTSSEVALKSERRGEEKE